MNRIREGVGVSGPVPLLGGADCTDKKAEPFNLTFAGLGHPQQIFDFGRWSESTFERHNCRWPSHGPFQTKLAAGSARLKLYGVAAGLRDVRAFRQSDEHAATDAVNV